MNEISNSQLYRKYKLLQNILQEMGTIAVAFSGGVDSTLLLKVAWDVLGKNVLAVTAVSETTPAHEKKQALSFVQSAEIPHICIQTEELSDPKFVSNPQDRCYICKKMRFGKLVSLAKEKGYDRIADGENLDDSSDFRPGRRAVRELGIQSPLRDVGFGKSDIRELSKELGLSTWNKPAYACLASRIPYGHKITAEKLRQIDEGEEYIRQAGLAAQVRVRHEGDTARIEVPEEDIAGFSDPRVRKQVVTHFKNLGFHFIALDLEGYRMGSLNQSLRQKII